MSRRYANVVELPDTPPPAITPSLAQLEAAKLIISAHLTNATPLDEHIIQIALLLAMNMAAIVGETNI